MLPINTQAQANSDKLMLETLQKQGEVLSNQSKTLEKLVNELSKQSRSNAKVSTKAKAEASTDNQKQGFFDKPMRELLEMFKFESGGKDKESFSQKFKFESGGKTQETEKPETTKDTKDKSEDENILKSILEKFNESSEFQKQMAENSKTLQMISDITKTNSSIMKDDLAFVKKSYEDGEKEKDREALAQQIAEKLGVADTPEPVNPETNNKKEDENSQEKLSTKIGKAVAENITRGIGLLLTTKDFKQISEKNTDNIIEALQGLNTGGGGGGNGIDIPGGTPGKGNKTNIPKTDIPGTPPPGGGQPPKVPPLAAGSPLLAAGVVTSVIAGGAALTYGATNVLNNMSDEQLQQLSQDTGSDTGLAAQAILSGRATEEEKAAEEKRINQEREDLKDAPFLTKYYGIGKDDYMKELEAKKKKEADKKRLKELVQQSKEKELKKKQKQEEVKVNPNLKNEAGPQEDLVIPKEMENLSANETAVPPVEPVAAVAPKALDAVTEQKQELNDTKTAAAPITVINNNTNNVGGGGGQSMNFAAATAVNTDTSINDFFRSHGRILA
jgi:hypothetical protein